MNLYVKINSFYAFTIDNEIKRTDFLENIFDCYKTKGKQSFVPINFNINAFAGKKNLILIILSALHTVPDSDTERTEHSMRLPRCQMMMFQDLRRL